MRHFPSRIPIVCTSVLILLLSMTGPATAPVASTTATGAVAGPTQDTQDTHAGPADDGATEETSTYSWPLDPRPPVTRPFDRPPCTYCPGHRGVDLGSTPGRSVHAASSGVVIFADQLAGRGVVSIAHGDLRTTYEPVVARVSAGESVRRGDEIGVLRAGHPGCAAPACLHWGVRRGETYLDPLRLLAPDRIRLKPVHSQ